MLGDVMTRGMCRRGEIRTAAGWWWPARCQWTVDHRTQDWDHVVCCRVTATCVDIEWGVKCE